MRKREGKSLTRSVSGAFCRPKAVRAPIKRVRGVLPTPSGGDIPDKAPLPHHTSHHPTHHMVLTPHAHHGGGDGIHGPMDGSHVGRGGHITGGELPSSHYLRGGVVVVRVVVVVVVVVEVVMVMGTAGVERVEVSTARVHTYRRQPPKSNQYKKKEKKKRLVHAGDQNMHARVYTYANPIDKKKE